MFKPWIGNKFGQEDNFFGGLRLLVVGESHYSHNKDEVGTCGDGVTTEVVNEYALDKPHRFFTGLTQVLCGRKKYELSKEDLQNIWDSICFYNYIPVYLGDSRIKPDQDLFKQGATHFNTLVDDLKPQAILVCGFRLWWWVLNGVGFEEKAGETPPYIIGSAFYGRMKHPSSAFSSDYWRGTVMDLISKAKFAGQNQR